MWILSPGPSMLIDINSRGDLFRMGTTHGKDTDTDMSITRDGIGHGQKHGGPDCFGSGLRERSRRGTV